MYKGYVWTLAVHFIYQGGNRRQTTHIAFILCEVRHDTLLQYLMKFNHIMSTCMGLHMDYLNMCCGFKLSIYRLVSLWDVVMLENLF